MATAAAKAEAPPAEQPAPKGKKKLIMMVAAAVALLGAGGGAAWFFLGNKSHGDAPPPVAKKQTEFMSVEPYFTVNLTADGDERYLQAGLVYEISNNKADTQLKARMPLIRSDILLLLSGKSTKELLTPDGKRKLAGEVLELTRKHLDVAPPENGIEGVHFSIFVIQ